VRELKDLMATSYELIAAKLPKKAARRRAPGRRGGGVA
jgi:predicted DNA-binding protein (MmcQ/YjbR family)